MYVCSPTAVAIETDRRTKGQIDKRTNELRGRRTDEQIERKTDRRTVLSIDRQAEKQTNRHMVHNIQTDKGADRQTVEQTDIERNIQTYI